MKYYRVHTADIAYYTGQPRGIFVAIWKLVEEKILTEAETKEYWKTESISRKSSPCRRIMQREILKKLLLGSKIRARATRYIIR